MPKYVIERNMPGAAAMPEAEWINGAKQSNDALHAMGTDVQWIESYVTDDKVYCVYIAPNEELVREHGKRSGFPVDKVSRVGRVIDPTTAETGRSETAGRLASEAVVRQ